jgi:hypothetical protein
MLAHRRTATGKPETQTSGAEKITIQQADRLMSLTESLVVFARETAQNTSTLRALDAFLRPPTYAPLQAPSLASLPSIGAGATVLQITIRIQNVNHFHGNVGAGADAIANEFGQQLGAAEGESIDNYLASSYLSQKQLMGNPIARG